MRFFLATIVVISLCSCDSLSQQRVRLKTKQDSVSYAIGVLNGKNMKAQETNLDINMMTAGMKDAMSKDGKTILSESEVQALLQQFQNEMMQKQQEKMASQGNANKQKGDAFLAANKNKPGVITTASGLQYRVISSGPEGGAKPTATSTVKAHYRGTLIDGTEFDSSYKRGEPAEFPLANVIKGWTEGLQLMKVGDKFELVIPPDLGYGLNAPPSIGPNQVLIFEVELLDVKN
jgi:FKBP-type peptidyl-prolyl cis-trans isomerase